VERWEKKRMHNVTYASVVGSLMYTIIFKGPDIVQAFSIMNRFMSNSWRPHWKAVKWILRYLRGTTNMKLCFDSSERELIAYSNLDLAGYVDGGNSTFSYLVTHSGGGAVAWQIRLKKCVVFNTIESKFIMVTEVIKDLFWLNGWLESLVLRKRDMYCFSDNQSVTHLSKNPSTKHIEIRYHWVKAMLNSKQMQMKNVHAYDNIADMLTKVVTISKLDVCRRLTSTTAGRQWDHAWCWEGEFTRPCPSTWRCVDTPTSFQKSKMYQPSIEVHIQVPNDKAASFRVNKEKPLNS
jgi:hypothetical protein